MQRFLTDMGLSPGALAMNQEIKRLIGLNLTVLNRSERTSLLLGYLARISLDDNLVLCPI